MTKIFETLLECPIDRVWEFHASVDALEQLTPPSRKVEVLSQNIDVADGALHVLRVRQFGIPLVWKARISEVEPPFGFTDTAEKSPFKSWQHRHDFIAQGETTLLRDTVNYEMPFGILGIIARKLFVDRDIETLFAFRHEATKRALKQWR